MLTLTNISYKVGNKTLLDNISVVFAPGKLNLIIGPNGAGKSTLVKVMSKQLPPWSGHVQLDDRGISDYSLPELARIRAVLSQHTDIAFPLNVQQVVMMGRYPHFTGRPSQKDKTACREAMRFFDVEGMAGRTYQTLSGGEKQRVQFARVLSQIWYPPDEGHRYLILDEPLAFLDVHYQFDFMQKLLELLRQQDMVIAGVVHDLNLAAKFGHHIVLLNQGKLLASGSREEVLTARNIETAYQVVPEIHRQNGGMHILF